MIYTQPSGMLPETMPGIQMRSRRSQPLKPDGRWALDQPGMNALQQDFQPFNTMVSPPCRIVPQQIVRQRFRLGIIDANGMHQFQGKSFENLTRVTLIGYDVFYHWVT